ARWRRSIRSSRPSRRDPCMIRGVRLIPGVTSPTSLSLESDLVSSSFDRMNLKLGLTPTPRPRRPPRSDPDAPRPQRPPLAPDEPEVGGREVVGAGIGGALLGSGREPHTRSHPAARMTRRRNIPRPINAPMPPSARADGSGTALTKPDAGALGVL